MAELQGYATANQKQNENGLKVVHFDRKPDEPLKLTSKNESEAKKLQQLGTLKRIAASRQQQVQGQDMNISGIDSQMTTQDKFRPVSQPTSQQADMMASNAFSTKTVSAAYQLPQPQGQGYSSQRNGFQSTFAKSSENLFQQPAQRHLLYKVSTNNCYDSVIEQNLNTGLPKKISCITSKHL